MLFTKQKIKLGIILLMAGATFAYAETPKDEINVKFVRYGLSGQEKPGVIDADNNIRDISSLIEDITPQVIESGRLNEIASMNITKLPRVAGEQRFGVPVNGVGKIVAIGFNYKDHVAETGRELPKEPVVFMKATTSLVGPNDDVMIPKNASMLDWEVELAIVIAKTARYVEEADAAEYILGYTINNDVSERAFQIYHGGQFVKGKSADTFGPLGPYISLRDSVDVNNLHIWLDVNGERQQDANTKQMIFKPEFLVSYLSSFMTLEPGDVIVTGTPAGIGGVQDPPRFLKPGDVVTLGITGLGEQRQTVISYTPTE